jgi:hypothetical protein
VQNDVPERAYPFRGEDDYIESEKDASEKYEYQEYVWHNTAIVTSKNKEQ